MDFYIFLLFCIFTSTLSFGALESTKTGRDLILIHRAKKVIELIKQRSCKQLTAGLNCTVIKTRPPSQMNFYMAEKLSTKSRLNMLFPLRPSPFHLYQKLDVVVVVDPVPDAHFGHNIIAALVKIGISEVSCKALNGIYYTSPSKFVTLVTEYNKHNVIFNSLYCHSINFNEAISSPSSRHLNGSRITPKLIWGGEHAFPYLGKQHKYDILPLKWSGIFWFISVIFLETTKIHIIEITKLQSKSFNNIENTRERRTVKHYV